MNKDLNNIPEKEDNNSEHKKTLYVPDEELLKYNKKRKKKNDDKKPLKELFIEFCGKIVDFMKFIIPKKKDGLKTIIIKSVAIVAALALISSIVYLIVYFSDLSNQNAEIDNVRATYELNRNDYTYNSKGQFSKFDNLRKQNSDICGWIEIPGTDVNNPVYQTIDNDFYINHDMNKQPNSYGALFLDYHCDIDPKSLTQNQIIYGHNMRFGAMFGTLDEYRNIEYYKANPIVNFDSLYEKRKYKIVAIMITNSSVDSTFGYDFTPYASKFSDQDNFMKWISRCRDRSLINTPVDVLPQDEVLTLSTCCYDFEEARLVIVARLVRDGEDETVDTELANINEDVLYSGEYYAARKLKIPEIN